MYVVRDVTSCMNNNYIMAKLSKLFEFCQEYLYIIMHKKNYSYYFSEYYYKTNAILQKLMHNMYLC